MTGDQITQLIVALTTLIGVITALVKAFRTDKKVVVANDKLDTNATKLANVEELVNGNHHIALARIDQLGNSLTNAGVAIPDSPPIKPGEGITAP